IGTILFVNKRTKQMVPMTEFLDMEGLLEDLGSITDASFGKVATVAELGVALLKNFRADKAPPGFTFAHLMKQFLSQTGARGKQIGQYETDSTEFEWRVLFVAGM